MNSSQYFGLSLPERLHQAKTSNTFADALNKKDETQMVHLLQSVGYTLEASNATIKTLLNDPVSFKAYQKTT